jgi:hypothetical protein
MTPRQLRRLKKRLDNQMERERNGEPIPGEIASRMTQLKDDTLYQIVVDVRGAKEPLAVCPKMPKQYCEMVLFEINKMICLGKERLWSNPSIIPCATIN